VRKFPEVFIGLVVLGILTGLNIFAWIVVFDLNRQRFLEVNFFDVGEGDAIFIETPKRHQILIDGGPSSVILQKLAKEMPFYDRTIDLVILTHPEKDHLFGLNEVLKRYKIENILWTGAVREIVEYQEWKRLIEQEKAQIFIGQVGKKIISPGVILAILHPLENLKDREIKDNNDTSIVLKLVFNQNSFILTGDISQKIEEELIIRENASLKSDVLKIAHHGSKYSNSENFLKNVSPKLAIIQVGKNFYGHPSEEVFKRLEKFGIKTLRTDKEGDIKIISDGKNLKIKKCFRTVDRCF